ncbi:Hpt domain-containing protein [Arthrobacter globiformis]|uniref:Hpt domain-containing protein n=1 Tax=Arthrobacter globiformis TaxID=1665 RepID=UPI00277DE7EA|nr:Hpt domain-containing protein [Arthrobacter globiformis]MDQ0865586.1 HPt (histidine-containing phosphotransfer) domain-containing protein [Arthrobacter globiformis]
MTGPDDIPVLDAGPLQVLSAEVGPAFAEAFIDDYLQMLPERASKILRALAGGDPRMAADAVVSLRATSAMAGALRLERCCKELESRIRRGQRLEPDAVRAVLYANIRLLVREAGRQGYLPQSRPKGQD